MAGEHTAERRPREGRPFRTTSSADTDLLARFTGRLVEPAPVDRWLVAGLARRRAGVAGPRPAGMMTLVSLAISAAWACSTLVVFGLPGEGFFWGWPR
jgi:hypothetical protein